MLFEYCSIRLCPGNHTQACQPVHDVYGFRVPHKCLAREIFLSLLLSSQKSGNRTTNVNIAVSRSPFQLIRCARRSAATTPTALTLEMISGVSIAQDTLAKSAGTLQSMITRTATITDVLGLLREGVKTTTTRRNIVRSTLMWIGPVTGAIVHATVPGRLTQMWSPTTVSPGINAVSGIAPGA